MFLINKSSVIAGIEGTPYDAAGETLLHANYDVRIKNDIGYSTEIDEYRRKYLEDTLDHDTSIIGRQRGTVTFTVDMAPIATASGPETPPAWSKLLQMCGFKETIFGSTGVSWVPHVEQTHVPGTINIVEQLEGASADQFVTRLQGCMGNVTILIGTVGEPVQMNFEFSGAWVSQTDLAFASKLDPTSLSVTRPGAILSSCFTVNSLNQDLDTFEFNMNNEISEWISPCRGSGIKGFYRSAFDPQLSLNPTMKQLTTEPGYTELIAGTTLATSITVASSDGPDIIISSPKAQRISHSPGERNGARTSDWNFLLTKDSGNDTFEILQGAKT